MSKQVKSTISDELFQAITDAAENASLTVSALVAGVLASHFNKPAQDSTHGGLRVNRWWPYFPGVFVVVYADGSSEDIRFHSSAAFALWYSELTGSDGIESVTVNAGAHTETDLWADENIDLLNQLLDRGSDETPPNAKLGVVWVKKTSTKGGGLDGRSYHTRYATEAADLGVSAFVPGNSMYDTHSIESMPESTSGWTRMYVAYRRSRFVRYAASPTVDEDNDYVNLDWLYLDRIEELKEQGWTFQFDD